MDCILSFDVGTTGLKTVIMDQKGQIIKSCNTEYAMIQQTGGFAEQHPSVWWEAVIQSVRSVMDAKIRDSIKAIGISGQFQSLVMLDKDMKPLRNAILWCDQRGEEMLPEITERVGKDRLFAITANPALTGSTASSLLWVRRHEPELFERCRHIMLPHEYIRLKLTGECITDVTSASSMQLLNVPERTWSREIFDKLELDPGLTGRLFECGEIIGKTTAQAEAATGIPKGIPVVAGGGDSVVSAIGTGVTRQGSCFTSIGTSGIICTNTDAVKTDRQGRVNTYCSAVPGKWTIITCSVTSGFALKWMKENFCSRETELASINGSDVYEEMSRLADRIKPGADGLIFLPYLMGDRTPHMNPRARAVFFGAASFHTKAHFIRSVLEGVAYSLKDGISVIHDMGIELDDFVLCGGGAKGKLWRQIIADVYGHNIAAVQGDSGAAMGAAVLAAYGSGMYPSLDDAVERMIKRKETESCNRGIHQNYMKYWELYHGIYARLEDVFYQAGEANPYNFT